uniref:Interferon gamma inducible protein 16 n=1 Tax=Prolemur simus TaxID=1328070 RepID=A0A8C9DP34_PROSS
MVLCGRSLFLYFLSLGSDSVFPTQKFSFVLLCYCTRTPKPLATSQATTRKPHLCKGSMVVMVLSAAAPFAYESSEKETKTMFHAMVATEKQFFHVKVFNIKLKRIFTRRIITISDYFRNAHLLEVNEASSVSEAGPDQKIEVPNNIINRAKKTLLIDIIKTQASGTIVYGLFTLHTKIVHKNSTIYEIQDNTGNMEVVGKGKCHDIPCEEGDKLQLFCFQLRKKNQTPKLILKYIVMKKTNQRIYDSNTLKISKEQSEAPKRSEASAALIQSHPQTPQMPPEAPSSTFLSKGKDGTKRIKVGSVFPTQNFSFVLLLYHTQQPKPPAISQATTRKPDLRKGPMVVMVLSAADPFAYESSEKETKTMFHATVATEKQFFHMKVFNINLKRKFIRNRIIILSDYFENAHLLEVNEASSVSEACPDQKMEVPNNIKKRAKETLPIDIIKTQASGTIVYGLFMLHKKIVNKNNTIYEIQDNTGNMEVVGKGKCHNIPCEEGDKLQLFCFRLRKKKQTPTKLISEIHSFIQVRIRQILFFQRQMMGSCF